LLLLHSKLSRGTCELRLPLNLLLQARSGPPRVTEMNGTWTAVIDLAGEAYQAFFKNFDSARESFNAATQHLDLAP
jgi:hypothetical protein